MQDLVGHLVRRGAQYTNTIFVSTGDNVAMPQFPAWGITLVYGTIFVFILLISAVQYTIGDVVGTLTMIETPATAMTIPPSEEEADKKDSLLAKPQFVPVKPITSKIRTTVRHITAIGGRWACWRAVAPAIIYSILYGAVTGFLDAALPAIIPARQMVLSVVTAVMLARVHMAWTHAVISMPSALPWYKRMGAIQSMKTLWVPTAVNVVASYAVIYLTIGFGILMKACNGAMANKKIEDEPVPKSIWVVYALQTLAFLGFAVAMSLFVILPSAVTLARVEASMLPDDQETIVPFDRTFGGKVTPQILGGTGAIGFVDAWRTFDWEARRRLVKLYLKDFLVMTGLTIAMAHIVLFEAWAIMGPELVKLMASLNMVPN